MCIELFGKTITITISKEKIEKCLWFDEITTYLVICPDTGKSGKRKILVNRNILRNQWAMSENRKIWKNRENPYTGQTEKLFYQIYFTIGKDGSQQNDFFKLFILTVNRKSFCPSIHHTLTMDYYIGEMKSFYSVYSLLKSKKLDNIYINIRDTISTII